MFARFAAYASDAVMCRMLNEVQARLSCATLNARAVESYFASNANRTLGEFYALEPMLRFAESAGSATWQSPVTTAFRENNRVQVKFFLTREKWSAPTVIFLHALMSASDFGYRRIAGKFNRAGWNAALIQLPYHFKRTPAGYPSGALALSSDVIRNAETLRQAVQEVRQLLFFVRARGARRCGLIGTSYGGWVSALVACLEAQLEFAALLQPLVDLEDIIWRSPAAVSIRKRLLQAEITEGFAAAHAHLSFPLHIPPPEKRSQLLLVAGAYDRLVQIESLQLLAKHWHLPRVAVAQQGHFGYAAMAIALRQIFAWIENPP
jgi:hypothetical protein